MSWRDMNWLPDNITTLKLLIRELLESNSICEQELILERYKQHYEKDAPHLYDDD
jgi:hypothetical protein